MKKILIGLVLLMMLFVLVSCGKKGNEQESEHEHTHEHTHEHNDAEVTLRLALSAHEGEPHYVAAEQFAEKVEAKTNGSVKVQIYDSNKLGTEEEVLEAIAKDEKKADIVIADVKKLTKYEPKIDISKMPFIFADYEEAREFMDGEVQTEAERKLTEQNIQVLAHYANGFNCLVVNGKMISDVKDMQGITVATTGQGMSSLAMKSLGAMTRVVENREVMQMLQQGRCDGYEERLEVIFNNRIYQNQDYLLVTNHGYSASCFVIANSVWNNLDVKYRELIEEAALSSSYTSYELAKQRDSKILEQIESAGVRVQYPNLKEYWEKAQAVVRGYEKEYSGMVDKLIMWKNNR